MSGYRRTGRIPHGRRVVLVATPLEKKQASDGDRFLRWPGTYPRRDDLLVEWYEGPLGGYWRIVDRLSYEAVYGEPS